MQNYVGHKAWLEGRMGKVREVSLEKWIKYKGGKETSNWKLILTIDISISSWCKLRWHEICLKEKKKCLFPGQYNNNHLTLNVARKGCVCSCDPVSALPTPGEVSANIDLALIYTWWSRPTRIEENWYKLVGPNGPRKEPAAWLLYININHPFCDIFKYFKGTWTGVLKSFFKNVENG